MYNKLNNELNSILENHKKEINTIIVNYILLKTMIYASEVFEKVVSKVVSIKQQGKE
jgi:hypothetical protein